MSFKIPPGDHSYAAVNEADAENAWQDIPSAGLAGHDREGEPARLATTSEKKRIWWRSAGVTSMFMLTWFVIATILNLYNKWLVDKDGFAFPYPLFVTSLHMWVQFALASTLRYTMPETFRPPNNPSLRDYGTKVAPTAVSQAVDIGFSNWALKVITLSLVTMVKSSTLIFVLFFAFMFKLETFSLRLVAVIFLIFIGVIFTVAAEAKIVVSGVILVLTASACSGLRWSLTNLILKSPKMGMDNPAATLFWLAPCMGVTLSALSIGIDGWGNVFSSPFFELGRLPPTIFFFILPGVLAFVMVISEFYIVQRVGVVPMSIAGIFKEVATLSMSAWVFGDRLNPVNATGIVITFIGILLFTYHKYRKSIDSNVPLDAHGNPIVVDDGRNAVDGRISHQEDDINERSHLAHGFTDEEVHNGLPPSNHVLFSAGDLEEVNSPPPRTRASVGDTVIARDSFEAQRQWSDTRNTAG